MLKPTLMVLAVSLGGCTFADRNIAAVGLCERTAGCTVTRYPVIDGPPQVQAMENAKPTSRTTER